MSFFSLSLSLCPLGEFILGELQVPPSLLGSSSRSLNPVDLTRLAEIRLIAFLDGLAVSIIPSKREEEGAMFRWFSKGESVAHRSIPLISEKR